MTGSAPPSPSAGRPTTRTLVLVGLAVALLLAGIVSGYASTNPDGLQYVAETLGFADQARSSATDTGPLAGYQTRGVADPGLSRGLAGVAGSLVVLALAGGLFFALRHRGGRPAQRDHEEA